MSKAYSDGSEDPLYHRIGATAIANQAILKCILSEIPVTIDNAILFVGDFVAPDDPDRQEMIGLITRAIEDVVETADIVRTAMRH